MGCCLGIQNLVLAGCASHRWHRYLTGGKGNLTMYMHIYLTKSNIELNWNFICTFKTAFLCLLHPLYSAKWTSLVLSDYTSYCSLLGAILEVLWIERGWGVQKTDRDVPLLLRQVCDLLMCPGIALPVHRTNGFKWLPNHWALHVYFSLVWSEGMEARNAEKAPYLWINLIDQHIYIAFVF